MPATSSIEFPRIPKNDYIAPWCPELQKLLEMTSIDSLEWSVRARNCLEQSGCKNLWDAAVRDDKTWRQVRNLGRKTLAEIKEKIAIFIKFHPQAINFNSSQTEQLPAKSRGPAKWVGHPDPLEISKSDWASVVADLDGKLSCLEPIGEIAAKIGVKWPRNRYGEVFSDFLIPDLDQLKRQTALGKTKIRTIIMCAIALWAKEHQVADPTSQNRTHKLQEISRKLCSSSLAEGFGVAFLLAGLNAKERKIFVQRYGLFDGNPQTLEEVGQFYQVTRERIRQVQELGRSKLILPTDLRCVFEQALDYLEPLFFHRLAFEHSGFIRERTEKEMLERLGGWESLLVELLHNGISEWLDKRTERTPFGWLFGGNLRELDNAKETLAAYLQDRGLPVPIVVASRETGISENMVAIAALHGAGSLADSFVVSQSLSARERRVLGVHVQTRSDNSPLLKRKLLPLLFYPEMAVDPYSSSTFNHDVGCFRQLLLPCGSEYVLRITPAWEISHLDFHPALPPHVFNSRHKAEENGDGENFEEERLLEVGLRLLKTRKIWRVRELMDELVEVSGGRFAGTSAGALLASPEVRRFAPGLWGWKDSVLADADYELLLQPEDCELYVEARHCNADLSLFPMWNFDMEFRWCRWARDQTERENVYQSLLSVITPDKWNCPIPLREQWKKRQRDNGRYRLAHPPRKALAQLPVLADEFLAAVGSVVGREGTTWMDLNILHGRTIDSHRSAPFLAILIALRVVEPTNHWQEFHPVGPSAVDWFHKLCRLWCEGSPDRSHALIEEVRSEAQKYSQQDNHLGWVLPDELQSLLTVFGRAAATAEECEVPI